MEESHTHSRPSYNIHLMCRICLEYLPKENAYDLFANHELAKKLCVCTSLSVGPHDGYPRQICYDCCKKLDASYEFKNQCISSVTRFSELLANGEVDTAMEATMVEANIVIDPAVMMTDGSEMDPNDSGLNHKVEIIEIIQDILEENEENAKAAADTIIMSEEEVMPDSVIITETVEDDGDGEAIEESVVDEVISEALDEEIREEVPEISNTIVVHPRKFHSLCQPRRKRPVVSERSNHRVIECLNCHIKVFVLKSRLDDTSKPVIDAKNFVCPNCGCTNPPDEAEELTERVMEIPKKRAKSATAANSSVSSESPTSDDKRFQCSYCSRTFRKLFVLQNHERTHTGEKPFICKTCGKSFIQLTNLRRHENVHNIRVLSRRGRKAIAKYSEESS